MRYLLFLFLAPALASFAGPSEKTSEFINYIEKEIPKYLQQHNAPGMAVALIENGEVVYEKGFGFQDAEKKRPVDSKTGFNIGSISKTVAAWAVMTLVEEGRVDLDAPISKYVTRWTLPPSEFDPDGVTIARLLSHTAGLSLHGYPGFPPNATLPSLEASLSGAINEDSPGVTQIMEPGTKWKYSGGGYTLLQLMIEEVTGQSFEDYARDRVLKPLGLNNTDYHLSADLLSQASDAHNLFGKKVDYIRFTAQAAAGCQTNIHDFALFAAASMKGPNNEPPGRGVLKPETLKKMMEPQLDGKAPSGLGYFTPRRNLKIRGHGGDNTGWHANFEVAPDLGYGIVILTNSDGGAVVRDWLTCQWEASIGVVNERGCKLYSLGLVMERIKDKGAKDLWSWYQEAEKTHADTHIFHEAVNNQLGFFYMEDDQLDNAIEVFILNTKRYPESFNTWDSLGYAYMKAGKTDLAIKNYRKSIELNPKNEEGKGYLEKLLAEKNGK